MNSPNRTRSRKAKGTLIVELAASCFFLLLFAAVAADAGVVIYSIYMNDRACRDAARAATMAQNSTEAKMLASVTMKAHAIPNSSMASSPQIISVVYQDYQGNAPPGNSPFVQISTITKSSMPFAPVAILGQEFGQSMSFYATYTYPILKKGVVHS